MARMIPPQIGLHSDPPPGEEKLFSELRDAAATRDWIVLHSLDVAKHQRQISGEIDFVLIIPEHGVLCLEVKSHRHIVYDDGEWFYGREQQRGRSPFRQVKDSMFSLLDDFKKKHPDLGKTLFWSAACFPFTVLHSPSSTPEWHSWQLIDNRRLQSKGAADCMLSVLKGARRYLSENANTNWFDPDNSSPSQAECNIIAEALRPRFEFYESPASRSRRRQQEIKQYTEQQFRALDHMARNPQVFFEGPAGTGKTFLALEAARRASARGERVLLACYNRFLGRWLNEETADFDRIRSGTFHSYLTDVAGDYQAPDQHDNSRYWDHELPNKALRKLLDRSSHFDRLIIDEAQDLLQPDFLDVLDASVDGGLKYGRWIMTGDFANQTIYSGTHFGRNDQTLTPEEFLSRYSLSVPRFSLVENCRNTPEVASFVESTTHPEQGYEEILRPSTNIDPVIKVHSSNQDQAEILTSILQNLYSDNIRGDDIIILSPINPENGAVGHITESPWSDRIQPYGQNGEGYIKYATIHSFKGLEAATVVVTDLNDASSRRSQELLYVAASRSQERLFLLVNETVKDELLTQVFQ